MSRTASRGEALLAAGSTAAAALIVAVGLVALATRHLPIAVRDLVDVQLPYLQGQPLGPTLAAIHVDHLIVFQRLLAWIDVTWLAGAPWASLAGTALSCLALGGFAAAAARGDGRESGLGSQAGLVPLAGAVGAAGLLWLGNGYNLAWPLQACSFMVPAFGMAALALLLQSPQPSPAAVAGAVLLAACAGITLGTGLSAVVALGLLALALRLPIRLLLPLLLALALLLAALLWGAGLATEIAERKPLARLGDPLRLLDYLLAYLAAPARAALDGILGPTQARLAAHILSGVALLALVGAAALWLRRRPRPSRLAAQGWLLCLLGLGSALSTAAARLSGEYGQATPIRYLTSSLVFWIGLVLLLLLACGRRLRPAGRRAVLLTVLAVQLVLLAGLPRGWSAMEARRGAVLQATAELLAGPPDEEALLRIYPKPAQARLFARWLRARPAAPFTWPEAGWIGRPASHLGAASDTCGLATAWLPERETESGSVALAGWVSGAVTHVLLLDSAGRVAALTWPTAGTRAAERPAAAPERGWELWLSPQERTAGRLVALAGGRLCPLPWPQAGGP